MYMVSTKRLFIFFFFKFHFIILFLFDMQYTTCWVSSFKCTHLYALYLFSKTKIITLNIFVKFHLWCLHLLYHHQATKYSHFYSFHQNEPTVVSREKEHLTHEWSILSRIMVNVNLFVKFSSLMPFHSTLQHVNNLVLFPIYLPWVEPRFKGRAKVPLRKRIPQ